MIWLSLPPALLLGLASALHCLGMCGGIMGGFMLMLPNQTPPARRLMLAAACNIGRITSYSVLGMVAALLGSKGFAAFTPGASFGIARILAALLVGYVGIGMMLDFPGGGWLNRHVRPLWQKMIAHTHMRHLNPGRSIFHAALYGSIWGFLPCGLVYTALAYAILAPGPVMGGASMALFGLGTLPGLLLPGILKRRPGLRFSRSLVGGLLVGYAGLSLFLPGDHNPVLCLQPAATPAASAKTQY